MDFIHSITKTDFLVKRGVGIVERRGFGYYLYE